MDGDQHSSLPLSQASYTLASQLRRIHTPREVPPRQLLERGLKIRGVLFSRQRPYDEARRTRISLVDLRLRSNEARGSLARKPFGRQVFWPQPSLARHSKPALGILVSPRLPQPTICFFTFLPDTAFICRHQIPKPMAISTSSPQLYPQTACCCIWTEIWWAQMRIRPLKPTPDNVQQDPQACQRLCRRYSCDRDIQW
jgi:hypothetical protein